MASAENAIGMPALIGPAPPPVTVGLPVYNGEHYLSSSLASLLSQTYEDFELLISDNCSDDATEEICRTAARSDPRIRYERQDRNVGVIENHNWLVRNARSPFFTWASSDDAYAPERIERMYVALQNDDKAVLAFTWARQIDENDAQVGSWHNPCRTAHPDPAVRLYDLLALVHENYHCYGLVRRNVMLRTMLEPPVWNSDRILVAELTLHGPFVEVAEELLWHRLHDRRVSASLTHRQFYATQRMNIPRIVAPSAEEGYWYLRAVLRSPVRGRDRVRTLAALRPWLRDNWMRVGYHLARGVTDGVLELVGLRGRSLRDQRARRVMSQKGGLDG
ncbi:glycosyl transferase [Longimycelium tulufanense]|uniref:Glycosyl transferase n=2 Tax=Longimycelium tulufanense TaxID=907463 RepID=A0A8J3FWH5_9PSEU|nr:glycosyl transferase [Longimycelium tulufanense]